MLITYIYILLWSLKDVYSFNEVGYCKLLDHRWLSRPTNSKDVSSAVIFANSLADHVTVSQEKVAFCEHTIAQQLI